MSSIGYGQYNYGIADYGTPTYHFGQATISGTTGISPSPSLVFAVTNETINAVAGVSAIGSQVFNATSSISATSSTSNTGTRLAIGVPLPIIQNSGWLAHGTQVDQAESYIQINSGFNSFASPIFVGVSSTTQSSGFTASGIQIDLGSSTIPALTNFTSVGTQIDQGVANISVTSNFPNITGIQIDLGASVDCIEVSNLGTDTPLFPNLNKTVTVNNFFVIDGVDRPLLKLASGYNYKFDVSDSTNANNTFAFAKINEGTNNTDACKIFVLTDASGNEYLQMSGASPVTTGGGAATSELRTLYHYTGDSGTTPTYTGTGWAYVYPTQTVTVDSSVTATVSYQLVSGYYVLTINGKPVYQYSGDTKLTANGVGTNWKAFKSDGTLQSTTPSGAMTSGIVYTTNVTRNGTPGSNGAFVQYSPSSTDDLDLFYYSEENINYGNIVDVSRQYAGVESVLALVGPPTEIFGVSDVNSNGVRTLAGVLLINGDSGLSSEGVIKWIDENNPNTAWIDKNNPNTVWEDKNNPNTVWTKKTIAA